MTAGFHQTLLQTGQRPSSDSLGQRQPPPQVSEVIGNHAQPQPHLVRPKAMATQPRHLHRLLAFVDALLGGAAFVIEAHHCPARRAQVGHEKAHARAQLPGMMLDLRVGALRERLGREPMSMQFSRQCSMLGIHPGR